MLFNSIAGFEEIRAEEKSKRVGQVFSSVASSYDTMNDLMSGGLHRLWKDRLVTRLQPFAGMQHLDVAGGTGDVAFRVLGAMGEEQAREQEDSDAPNPVPLGQVHVCDINPDMLQAGQRKALQQHIGEGGGLSWVVGDAEQLPFQDNSMDAYTIAFGIRNVTNIDAALDEAFRVLKKGGAFHCLEFSQLALPGLRELYDAYSFRVIPQIGRVVANDEASYQYLVESIRRFPDQKTFASLIREAQFSGVSYENLSGGICAIHSGFKI
ncbi:putative ubiquinone/menaquinone biosynthesis methyltransferase [Coccomyxa subellipsoidea C-169]|uniref:2-methoxy-6-polyprenyl-1,4-benzoquinol methylase, mitochondrial n=1 Tax=Coccomyxa subellipsoidea (strain C-169) TaxID=574566 RepID=I0YZV1_COCSC|nr:putative ubiquinone/menaquinone biosynthesis methyltransferase [Coccomyxa subellipsoidea C-169]EIE23920.1 putative ubiquinone/menaquinone biosynthesis methyltransferase [Coccomyxa subellipsoidea C-169]|eukprot:XP_005648464.1 putative ubiquinone/menaquinone biosynthesis methyltransferase [Coccomyxa subellipsoidea C-169]